MSGVPYYGSVQLIVVGGQGSCAVGAEACRAAERVAEVVDPTYPEVEAVVTTGGNNLPAGSDETWFRNNWPYRRWIPERFEPAIGPDDYRCPTCPAMPFESRYGRARHRQVLLPSPRNPVVGLFFVDTNALDDDPLVRERASQHSPIDGERRWLEDHTRSADAGWQIVVMHHSPWAPGRAGGTGWSYRPPLSWDFTGWYDMVIAGGAAEPQLTWHDVHAFGKQCLPPLKRDPELPFPISGG